MRPSGVSVLSILAGILGVLALLVGVIALGASAFIAPFIEENLPVGFIGITGAFIATVLAILGVVVIIFGVLHILVAYGLWVGAGWAWWLTMVLAILGAIGGLLTLPGNIVGGIIVLAIYVVIIWYFWQPYVKAYFGQARAPAPPPPPPPTPPPV
jgi:hypothetical protein